MSIPSNAPEDGVPWFALRTKSPLTVDKLALTSIVLFVVMDITPVLVQSICRLIVTVSMPVVEMPPLSVIGDVFEPAVSSPIVRVWLVLVPVDVTTIFGDARNRGAGRAADIARDNDVGPIARNRDILRRGSVGLISERQGARTEHRVRRRRHSIFQSHDAQSPR